MGNVFKQLAIQLDKIPNGYPETESGVELKILEKLFTPEEAQLACFLSLEPQEAKEVAAKSGGEERPTFVMLKGMTKKGLIEAERGQGGLAFKLMPFVVGFYEGQNARIDEEFARMFEDYYKEVFHQSMTMKPSVHRVIPVEKTVPHNIEVMPYERASTYIDNAQAWGVLPCICRVQKRLIGEGCHHTEENCMVFSKKPKAFDRTDAIRAISKDEALEILAKAGEEGLVHSTGNYREGLTYICNCCSCSCGVLRGIVEFGELNAAAQSDFVAVVDEDLCTGCEICIDRCQFKAITVPDGICEIDPRRCYGCGNCITTCPVEALSLVKKPDAELETPPKTEEDWMVERAKARGEVNQ